jgi:hypothetical protein
MNPRSSHFALVFLVGCGNPISNAMFIEDAEFLAAVPDFEDLKVEFPGEAEAHAGVPAIPLPGHASDLRAQSAAVAANLELTLSDLMTLGAFIRSDEPSTREDDLRSWGPASLENGSRALLLVDIVRSGVGQYDWGFMLGESSAGPWVPFYEGTHYSGATVAEGDGTLEADIGLLADALDQDREGVVRIDYDLREGTILQLSLSDYRETAEVVPLDAFYRYETDGSGAADFQYGIEAELSEGEQHERVGVRTRWEADTAMRADSRMYGGDLGSEVFTMSQCWDVQGALVFQEDSWGMLEPLGSESDCAFGKALHADDW